MVGSSAEQERALQLLDRLVVVAGPWSGAVIAVIECETRITALRCCSDRSERPSKQRLSKMSGSEVAGVIR